MASQMDRIKEVSSLLFYPTINIPAIFSFSPPPSLTGTATLEHNFQLLRRCITNDAGSFSRK